MTKHRESNHHKSNHPTHAGCSPQLEREARWERFKEAQIGRLVALKWLTLPVSALIIIRTRLEKLLDA